MEWHKKSLECVKMTPQLVKRFDEELATLPVDEQRFDKRHVALISNQIERGLFRAPEWAEVYCKEDHKTYRINGQHTSAAFAARNGSIPQAQAVVYVKYSADTKEAVIELYGTYDPPETSRSEGELSCAVATLVGLGHAPKSYLARINSGMGYALATVGGFVAVGKREKPRLVQQFPAFYKFAVDLIGRNWLTRAPVVAAMYWTHKKSRTAAAEFWQMVKEEDTVVGHPTRLLATYLQTHTPAREGRNMDEGKKIFYAKCIHAWNAYREDRTISHLGHPRVQSGLPAPV
jgi:hypothetical protein